MQLREDWHSKNQQTLCRMHYVNDIRANYAVCICGQETTAASVAVIHFFHLMFGIKKMAVIYQDACVL